MFRVYVWIIIFGCILWGWSSPSLSSSLSNEDEWNEIFNHPPEMAYCIIVLIAQAVAITAVTMDHILSRQALYLNISDLHKNTKETWNTNGCAVVGSNW